MAKQPTHLKLLFTRAIRVQKAHIAGSKAPEGNHDLMQIVKPGEEHNVVFAHACDLVLAESAIEIKPSNAEAIASAKEAIKERERQQNPAKAAQTAPKGRKEYAEI
jgi:hypothetical protein